MKLSKWLMTIMVLVCSASVWAKVNINTASLSELESLKGIGAKKAEKIIEYREKVGDFKSIEDLVNVSGIGTATLDKIRNEIEVSNNTSLKETSSKSSEDPKKIFPKKSKGNVVKETDDKLSARKEDEKSSSQNLNKKEKSNSTTTSN